MKVGVTGYSGKKFDEDMGKQLLEIAFAIIEKFDANGKQIEVVSGYTDMGIPALAYRLAQKKNYATVGIACSKAEENECYPVDKAIIVGDDWGDESETFLDYIDILVRIGGGDQATEETKTFKDKGKKVYEFDLPFIKE